MTPAGSSERASRPRLTIGYSVLADAAVEARVPAPRPGVEYLMVVQGGVAPRLRSDITVTTLDTLGVAKSRNAVLEQASGEYVLFADDDIDILWPGVDAALDLLDSAPETAIVLGRSVDGFGQLRKRYARTPRKVRLTNAAKAATFEIMVRLDAVRSNSIRFDERFGAGMPNHLGDEFIFLADGLRSGLAGTVLPATFARHPEVSSGMADPAARARAAVLTRVFGRNAWLSRVAFVSRRPLRFGSVSVALRFLANRFPPHP